MNKEDHEAGRHPAVNTGRPAISIRSLGHRYGGRSVLAGIDLDIEAGRLTVLLGKNGSGKSTLFRLIAGFLPITNGSIDLLGQPISGLSDRQRAHLLGFLPQQHRPVFPFTVRDVVLTGRAGHVRFAPRDTDLAMAGEAMTQIGIDTLGDRQFTELSGGEQQLVMLARVLAQRPRIILLDEPISHLDLAFQARVMTVLRALVGEGYSVVAILHDPNLAALYADRLVCLRDGRLIEGGTGATLRPEVLEGVYGMKLNSLQFRGKTLVLPR